MTKNLEKLIAELAKLPDGEQMGLANTLLVQLARQHVDVEPIRDQAHYFIGLVLLVDWDPIGVFGHPSTIHEYDSYIPGVFDLLASGANDKAVARHLYEIQSGAMKSAPNCSDLAFVTKKLRRVWNELCETQASSVLEEFGNESDPT
ncbi:MAG: hypothetical protein M3Y13_00925 [Armatimonadota bacterium]|nr:hypothetical protein [Armatimonadota bacterium]